MLITYKCQTCKDEQEIEVPDKHRAVDDFLWMQMVVFPLCFEDHRITKCQIMDLTIFIPENKVDA